MIIMLRALISLLLLQAEYTPLNISDNQSILNANQDQAKLISLGEKF